MDRCEECGFEYEPTDRSVMYGYPHRTERSLRWVAVHTLHEVRHHLLDIRRQLAESADSAQPRHVNRESRDR
jgi:hypothetical protein